MFWGLFAALTIALLAGCGDDGGSTAAEFVEAGNEICREGDVALAEASDAVLEAKKQEELSLDETAEFFSKEALPIARERLSELAELDAPESKKSRLADLVAAGRKAVDEIERGLASTGGEFLAASGPNPFAEFDAVAIELGLTGCAGRQEETQSRG